MIHTVVERVRETMLKTRLLGITYRPWHRRVLTRSLPSVLPADAGKAGINNGRPAVTRGLTSVTTTPTSTCPIPAPGTDLPEMPSASASVCKNSVSPQWIPLPEPETRDSVFGTREAGDFSSYCCVRERGPKPWILQIEKGDGQPRNDRCPLHLIESHRETAAPSEGNNQTVTEQLKKRGCFSP